jgi:TRAP-type mannitol/chloroaromatic compound transport system substrate-binding protein
LELGGEIYEDFNVTLLRRLLGRSGRRWFRNPINGLADLQGLKFRIAGLGGEVMRRLGVSTRPHPAGRDRPRHDVRHGSTPSSGSAPGSDRAFGLHRLAKFYYNPSFHEPGPGLEIIVNNDR